MQEAKRTLIAWWLISVVVFYSGSAASVISSAYKNSIVFIAAFFLIWRVIQRHHTVSRTRRTLFFLFFSITIFFNAIVTQYSTFYLRLFSTIYVAYEISERLDCRLFVEIYEKVITVLTAIGLIGYVAVNVGGLGQYFPRFSNINGEIYRGFIVFNYIERIPERNCALFWEPGLFATALTFALILEVLYVEKRSRPRIALYVAGIITAYSTAGYVLLALLLVLISMQIHPKQKAAKICLSIFQIVVVIASVAAFLFLNNILVALGLSQDSLFAKLMTNAILDSQRFRAIQDGFASFLKNPIWGVGAVKTVRGMNYVGDTATSIYAMSIFGIAGCGYSIFYIVGVLVQHDIALKSKLVFIIIVLGILNKEPHIDLLFTWVFGFFLFKNSENKMSEKYSASLFVNR